MNAGSTLTLEKPENGLAGLKHWRHDLLAGMVVSLVSVPFSLGIAVASGCAADLRFDLGDYRRIGAALPGWLVRYDQRARRWTGARIICGDAAARSRR